MSFLDTAASIRAKSGLKTPMQRSYHSDNSGNNLMMKFKRIDTPNLRFQ